MFICEFSRLALKDERFWWKTVKPYEIITSLIFTIKFEESTFRIMQSWCSLIWEGKEYEVKLRG